MPKHLRSFMSIGLFLGAPPSSAAGTSLVNASGVDASAPRDSASRNLHGVSVRRGEAGQGAAVGKRRSNLNGDYQSPLRDMRDGSGKSAPCLSVRRTSSRLPPCPKKHRTNPTPRVGSSASWWRWCCMWGDHWSVTFTPDGVQFSNASLSVSLSKSK